MIKIYSVQEAETSILARKSLLQTTYSPRVLEMTAAVFGAGVEPPTAVAEIIQSVDTHGDAALRTWSRQLDQWEGEDFLLPPSALEQAWAGLGPTLQQSLQLAYDRIRAFHELQPVGSWSTQNLGGRLGQRITPIGRVGAYVPGGTAPLPSSLLMSVIPAQVAGVPTISIATPPPAHPTILAAAYLCGLETIYQVGGAQAIAALALGTETIERVDKIVGAGNLFVTLAKQKLFGVVGIDGLAGPTETMIIADETANPARVAADLLAQAEHDVQARAILLTPDPDLARHVQKQVDRMVQSLSRCDVIEAAINEFGGIVITKSLKQAAELADQFAAEHLCLSVAEPASLIEQIDNAGGFFLGEDSCEVLGDYVAGPSHVMPTSGTARFASPLNVLDFVKISSVIGLDAQTARALSSAAVEFARAEGLTGHAAAAELRAIEL